MLPTATRDPRIREYCLPTRIVWQQGLPVGGGGAERLLAPGSGQATAWGAPGLQAVNRGRGRVGLCLDFGRELHGGVQIISGAVKDDQPVRVRVRFGESVSEAMGTPNQDHAIHDHTILLPMLGAVEVGQTGFRFVRIDLPDAGAEVELREIRAVALYRELPYLGAFRCSDERLNQIWHTGAYTVHLNLQDYLWDGIKRDRLVWLGDLHPEIMVVNAVFGRLQVVERSLDLVRDETPPPRFMNGLSSYSLWWIINQECWHLHHGDSDYLRSQHAYLRALLHELARHVDRRGREALPPVRFLDWPSSGDETVLHAGLHALLTRAHQAGARLARWLGDAALARHCAQLARRLGQHRPAAGGNKPANALKVLAGLADPQAANRRVLARKPAYGMSPFMGYYVLQARARAGDYQGCLDLLRTYWGAMLDLGATTFWEDFNIEWTKDAGRIDQLPTPGQVDVHADRGAYCYQGLRHSLCHGWAAGPTAWLSEHVLGCQPLQPGCAKLALRPHLGDLAWAEGAFPTPRGSVRVRHERTRRGAVATQYEWPALVGRP